MQYVKVAHIDITDKVWLDPVPRSGLKGFRSVVTAKTLDNTGLQRIYWWRFYPDSNRNTYSDACGEVNPCALNVNTSGMLVMSFLQGNQVKFARTHLDAVECPTGDSLLDAQAMRDWLSLLEFESKMKDPQFGTEHGGILYRNPYTGEIFFKEYITEADACSYVPPNGEGLYDPPAAWQIAMVHIHPFFKGEPFAAGRCKQLGNKPGKGGKPGPSDNDIQALQEQRLAYPSLQASYVIDRDSVYRIDPTGHYTPLPRNLNGCSIIKPVDREIDRLFLEGPALRSSRRAIRQTGAR